jgi:hypothetical protein
VDDGLGRVAFVDFGALEHKVAGGHRPAIGRQGKLAAAGTNVVSTSLLVHEGDGYAGRVGSHGQASFKVGIADD